MKNTFSNNPTITFTLDIIKRVAVTVISQQIIEYLHQ